MNQRTVNRISSNGTTVSRSFTSRVPLKIPSPDLILIRHCCHYDAVSDGHSRTQLKLRHPGRHRSRRALKRAETCRVTLSYRHGGMALLVAGEPHGAAKDWTDGYAWDVRRPMKMAARDSQTGLFQPPSTGFGTGSPMLMLIHVAFLTK